MSMYSFVISPFSADRLQKDINDSKDISVKLDYISALGDAVDVYFLADLSVAEQAVLDAIVLAHTGELLPDTFVQNVNIVSQPLTEIDSPKDSDNALIIQPKTTKTGWRFSPRTFVFVTARDKCFSCMNHNGEPLNDIEVIFLDSNSDPIIKGESESDVDYQARLTADCVTTVVDWWPQFDIDIIGGSFKVLNPPQHPNTALGWMIVAPDIPSEYGGNVEFGSGGWYLPGFAEKEIMHIDGRGVKRLVYDPIYKSNKLRTLIRHTAGIAVGLVITYDIFRI